MGDIFNIEIGYKNINNKTENKKIILDSENYEKYEKNYHKMIIKNKINQNDFINYKINNDKSEQILSKSPNLSNAMYWPPPKYNPNVRNDLAMYLFLKFQ